MHTVLLILLASQALASSCTVEQCDDFVPNVPLAVAGSVLLFLAASLATATGIGGGGIHVPILILVYQFPPKLAIPVSKATILGGAIIAFFINIRKRHDGVPLIDFHVVAMLQPLILFGTVLGVMAYAMLPEAVILALLCLILGIVTYKSARKAIRLFKAESRVSSECAGSPEPSDHHESKPMVTAEPAQHFTHIHGLILLNYLVFLAFTFLRGSTHIDSVVGITACSSAYFAATLAFGVYSLGASAATLKLSSKELRWTLKQALSYASITLLGGIAAGSFGIGGGLLISPLLLEIGTPPQVAAATSSVLVLFTSSSTTLQYLLMGALHWLRALVFLPFGAVASAAGVTAVHRLVERYKRPSIIAIILAVLLGLATVFLPGFELLRLDEENIFQFKPLCNS